MGAPHPATLHHQGRMLTGTAMLETGELVFEGDETLRVPLDGTERVELQGGALLLGRGTESWVFALGPKAMEWAEKIRKPKGRLEKLGVRFGQQAAILGPIDPTLAGELTAAGVIVHTGRVPSGMHLVFFGVSSKESLAPLATLRSRLSADGAVWMVRPKGRGALDDGTIRDAAKAVGLVEAKSLPFAPAHVATRYEPPRVERVVEPVATAVAVAPAKKAAPMKVAVKKAAPAKVPAKKAAPAKVPAKKAAPAKVPAKKAAPAKVPAKKPAPAKVPAKKPAPAKVPAKKPAPAKVPAKKSAPAKAPVKQAAPAKKPALTKESAPAKEATPAKQLAPVKRPTTAGKLVTAASRFVAAARGLVGSKGSAPDKRPPGRG